MGTITSGIGLISGINTSQIIDELISIESQPKQLLQARISTATQQKTAFTGLAGNLSDMQTVAQQLALPQTFEAATAKSSDENVLTATAANGAAVGTYQFSVNRLVTTQSAITNGFADVGSAPVGAGTITIEQGGGEASTQTPLSQLNGGAGVRRGSFRITDRAGHQGVIDISDAVTLDDVVKKINTSLNISVKATVTNNGIKLTDQSGSTTNDLTVIDLQGGSAAADLGIAGDAGSDPVAGNTLTGAAINSIGPNTSLGTLNDGLGVRHNTNGTPDFRITASDGTTFDITLGSNQTISDVLKNINNAGGGKLKAYVNPGDQGIHIQDLSGGAGTFSVAALGTSTAASDLGIVGTGTAGTLNGKQVIAGLDSVLISTLKGGSGLSLGKISIADRAGHSGVIDLSGSTSLSDLLSKINNNSLGIKVNASLNSAGTGIQVADTSGGGGNLVIGDVDNTTAAKLGIAGTFDTTKAAAVGTNLQRQYVGQNTLLSDLGGGKGVSLGVVKFTNSNGNLVAIDLSQGTINTVGDAIAAINAKTQAFGITAAINDNGNGIKITDTAGGPGKLTIADTTNSTAADLNIAGTATGTTIDGAYQKTISISATDTLADVQNKISNLGFAVTASIVNDGSGTNPYRLSITSTQTGRIGRVIIDGGTTNLGPRTLVQGQDASVLLGGSDSDQPLLITSHTNQLANVIKGVTINLTGTSDSPVTLNISRSSDNVQTSLQKFTDTFNTMITQIGTLTKFDTTTNQGGLLLGEGTPQQIQSEMYSALQSVVSGAGRYRTLADVGITITDGAQLKFDTDTFNQAFATDPEAVKNLFSQATTGLANTINNHITTLTDPVNGVITIENQNLDNRIQQFTDRSSFLDDIIAQKKSRLEEQFANMESVLAGLQTQQQALGSLSGVPAASTAKG
jgi:flagellar hook-associated protein 2